MRVQEHGAADVAGELGQDGAELGANLLAVVFVPAECVGRGIDHYARRWPRSGRIAPSGGVVCDFRLGPALDDEYASIAPIKVRPGLKRSKFLLCSACYQAPIVSGKPPSFAQGGRSRFS